MTLPLIPVDCPSHLHFVETDIRHRHLNYEYGVKSHRSWRWYWGYPSSYRFVQSRIWSQGMQAWCGKGQGCTSSAEDILESKFCRFVAGREFDWWVTSYPSFIPMPSHPSVVTCGIKQMLGLEPLGMKLVLPFIAEIYISQCVLTRAFSVQSQLSISNAFI